LRNLLIIGAGRFGREVYTLAIECIKGGELLTVKGFLDNNPKALDNHDGYPSIISDLVDYQIQKDDVFIIAITSPTRKKICSDFLLDKGAVFINLIHPSVYITQGLKLGKGIILSRECIISNDCCIEDFVTFNSRAMIGHDTIIQSYSHVNAGAFIGGKCIVGQFVEIHTMAIIVQNIRVVDSVTVGAGAVVLKNIDQEGTVFGNPAKRIF
jgi:sugar O-acyltransferase (sialic acid O-acetyltransferase NeuD family)